MSPNKEDLKNKIIYRASYRGTKEMDMLIIAFVKSIINKINDSSLQKLDEFVNMNDETLMSIKNKQSLINTNDPIMEDIIDKFQRFKL
jgi:antitoxin CptB|tara:strand:+ start:4138 stop:4401 length:264 start_codon:yes stop_codon:yes gene_type:complete